MLEKTFSIFFLKNIRKFDAQPFEPTVNQPFMNFLPTGQEFQSAKAKMIKNILISMHICENKYRQLHFLLISFFGIFGYRIFQEIFLVHFSIGLGTQVLGNGTYLAVT